MLSGSEAAPQVERVARPDRLRGLGVIGHAFEDEGVQPVIGVGIGAGQPFVEEDGQLELIRQLDRVGECMVALDPPVHLRPVEDVAGTRTGLSLVELADAFLHLHEGMLSERLPLQ